MRCLERNKRLMWLSTFAEAELTDPATGLGTGEYAQAWSDPVEVRINAAPQTGSAESGPFGTEVSYDLVLVADSNPWGIAEGSRMWLRDAKPDPEDAADAYEVRRVSPSLNFVAFGLTRRQGR